MLGWFVVQKTVKGRGAVVLMILTVLAVACSSTLPTAAPTSDVSTSLPVSSDTTSSTSEGGNVADASDDSRPMITVPLTLYRLFDEDGGTAGTSRSTEEIEAIGELVNEIWAQADIRFDPLLVRDLEVPNSVLVPIVRGGEVAPLFDALSSTVAPQDPGILNGFFLSQAFGVNGFAPSGTRTFFVVDEPTVFDQRVTSHEIGHLFELHHEQIDAGRLMFSGTNGMVLTNEEQVVARYAAQGILDALR